MQMIESNNIKNHLKDETICHRNLSTIHLIYKRSKTWKEKNKNKNMTNFPDKFNTWFLNFKIPMKDGTVVVERLKLEQVGGGAPWRTPLTNRQPMSSFTSMQNRLILPIFFTACPQKWASCYMIAKYMSIVFGVATILVWYLVSLTIGITRC